MSRAPLGMVLSYWWLQRILHPLRYRAHMKRVRVFNDHVDNHIPSLGGTRDAACPACQEFSVKDGQDD